MGDGLLKAIIYDYLYRHLPGVSTSRLTSLYREFTTSDRLSEYASRLTPQALDNFQAKQKCQPQRILRRY